MNSAYQNSVNPPVTLGISAKHFDRMHYLIRWFESVETPGTWTVMRAYCPIGTVIEHDGTYRVTRGGMPDAHYAHFGEAVAHLMVKTS